MKSTIIGIQHPMWQDLLNTLPHDIYHLPHYVWLEAQRINAIPEAILISEQDKIFFLPYLKRKLTQLSKDKLNDRQLFDVISPYGYPGILLNEPASQSSAFLKLALNQLTEHFSSQNICSAFLRLHPFLNRDYHQILNPQICHLSGETISIDLHLETQQIMAQTRSRFRTQINKSIRDGFAPEIVNFGDYLDEFCDIYRQTMARLHADPIYFFNHNYFVNLLNLNQNIHLCVVKFQDEISCAGLFTECCGIVQYHLGGTKDKFIQQSPSKLMLHHVRLWAKQRGNKLLHLGGGFSGSKDKLYHFKSGFSKCTNNYTTLRLIVDQEKYNYLVDLRAKDLNFEPQKILESNYFPSYRYQM